ncbi:MAG: Ig-like domain-containing protein [Campylobacterota bacterium]
MRAILPLIIAFFVVTGCDGTYDNAPVKSEPALSISLAAAALTPVPVNAQLILHASTALEPSTVNENSVYIQNSAKERTPAYITLIDQDIVVQPKIYLAANTDFELIVTTAVASSSGTHLTQNSVTPFTSGAASDFTAPTITSSLPVANTTARPYSKIYFQFSEPISPLGIDNSVITITNNTFGDTIPGTVNVSGSLISFTPYVDIPAEDVTWNIVLNINAITDLAGNGAIAGGDDINASFFYSAQVGFLTPKPLGSNVYNIGAPVNCIESSDNLVFVGSNAGLHLIEFDTVAETFTYKSHLLSSTIGYVYSIDIDVAANRAYVGSSTGLNIIDITQTTTPSIISSYETSAPVYGLDINGTDLYLAASAQGLIALDVTNETTPTVKFIRSTNGTAFDVATSTTGIILADYDQGVTRFDFNGDWPENYPTTHHARSLIRKPGTTTGFFSASGIGGVKHIDTSSTSIFVNAPPPMPSYTTAVVADGILDKVYTNDFGTGIGVVDSLDYFLISYIPLNIDIVTISSVRDTSGLYLILADTSGQLHSMQVE